MPPRRDKGKSVPRLSAPTNETDPLLPSGSRPAGTPPTLLATEIDHHRSRQRWLSALWAGVIALLSIFFAAALFLVLLAWSFKPSESELVALPKTAFRYTPPTGISVLSISDDGILVNVTFRCGVDLDQAMGISGFEDEEGRRQAEKDNSRGTGAEWWESLRRWTASMVVQRLPGQMIEVAVDEPIMVARVDSVPLLRVELQRPIYVPLISDIRAADRLDWLRPTSFTALAKPTAPTGIIWQYIQDAWMAGSVHASVNAQSIHVQLPDGGPWWTKYVQGSRDSLLLDFDMPVPRLPGLPVPGKPIDLAALVHLESYNFTTTPGSPGLAISALATIPNLPNITTTLPYSLPFSAVIPPSHIAEQESKMAEVITGPIQLVASRPIELSLAGMIMSDLGRTPSVIEASNDSSPLSRFLQNYLHGLDNPIVAHGLPSIPTFAPASTPKPPSWLLDGLPTLSLPLTFPGPIPKPKIIQSVTIERMRIAESRGKIMASGLVIAAVELPRAMRSVHVDVRAVLPDVLIYDGLAEDDLMQLKDDDGDQYPAGAFGRIRPDEFLNSTTEKSDDPFHPYWLIVRAPLDDVPLEILPGRDALFRSFVGKVVFRGGALAGVKGIAGVKVELPGVDGQVKIDGLPVKGETWVGKRRSLSDTAGGGHIDV